MYGQSTDQLDWTRDTLRLTGTETELLPALDRGVALWEVGQRSFIVPATAAPAPKNPSATPTPA
jgi:hypothetical protein